MTKNTLTKKRESNDVAAEKELIESEPLIENRGSIDDKLKLDFQSTDI